VSLRRKEQFAILQLAIMTCFEVGMNLEGQNPVSWPAKVGQGHQQAQHSQIFIPAFQI